VTREAMVQSAAAVGGARRGNRAAEEQDDPVGEGLAVQDLIAVYQTLVVAFGLCDPSRPHRGRHGIKGHRGIRRGVGILLQDGIGDTIRISLTPSPAAIARWKFRSRRNCCRPWVFAPSAAGGGVPRLRPHHPTTFQERRARSRISSARKCRPGRRAIPVLNRSTSRSWAASSMVPANQACRHRHLPARTGETPAAPVFVDGKNSAPCAANIATEFKAMVIDYIDQRYGRRRASVPAHGDGFGVAAPSFQLDE